MHGIGLRTKQQARILWVYGPIVKPDIIKENIMINIVLEPFLYHPFNKKFCVWMDGDGNNHIEWSI